MPHKGTVLIVDDESYVRESLVTILERRGFSVHTADGADEALKADGVNEFDAVLTDLKMPGKDGLTLLRELTADGKSPPIVVLTGHGTVLSAVECMKAGAHDYLLKPANTEQLVLVLERAVRHSHMRRELDYLRSGHHDGRRTQGPVGVSEGWNRVLEMVDAVAPSDATILLLGESGTGKEEVAQLLHRKSLRSDKPFVRVNCAAIPVDLFESEFFGYRKGAFTGALSDREGRFRVAHGGTLFMDEIGSMPGAAQAKVLRVLQDGVFERVGDSLPTSVDVRLIAASNADLEEQVEAGRFRRDLYYRINVVSIEIPPLRERKDDIPVLADFFLDRLRRRLGKEVRTIHSDTMSALQSYKWPGNVRELRNVIERAILLEKSDNLRLSSLPFNLREEAARVASSPAASQPLSLRERLAAEEKRILESALEGSRGVRREAARLLGIDERNLSYFLRKHGLMGDRKS